MEPVSAAGTGDYGVVLVLLAYPSTLASAGWKEQVINVEGRIGTEPPTYVLNIYGYYQTCIHFAPLTSYTILQRFS